MSKKLKRRADGRFRKKITVGIDSVTGENIYKYVYGYSEEELEEKEVTIRAKYSDIAYNEYTVGNYIKTYLEQRRQELASDNGLATVESYGIIMRKHCIPYLGTIPLVDLNVPILRDWLGKLPAGSRTKQHCYVIFKLILNRAVNDGLMLSNPLTRIKRPTHIPLERGVISDADMERLLKMTLSVGDSQMARIFQIDITSGLRRSEIIALTWGDIDFKNNTISVSHKIVKTLGKGLIEGPPKSKYGNRVLKMDDYSMAALRKQLVFVKSRLFTLDRILNSSCRVFMDEKGNVLSPDRVTRAFAAVRKKLELPSSITLHSLRHTLATQLSEADISPKKVQLRMGHATAAYTMDQYTHNTSTMQDSIVDILNKKHAK